MIPTDIVIGVRITREFPVQPIVADCIASIRAHTHNYRLIVVDDNSDTEYSQWLQDEIANFPSSIFIKTHFQHWFTRAYNLGLRMARTKYTMILNCDTVVDTGWLEELHAVKDEVEAAGHKVGLVGSVLSHEEPRRYDVCNLPGYVTGHALLLNVEGLSEISSARGTPGIYLDETRADMIHIRSDIDLTWKLIQHGYQCVTSFKAAVGHHGGKTWGHQLHRIPTTLDAVSYKY